MIFSRVLAGLVIAGLCGLVAGPAMAQSRGALMAASDGEGGVRLLWFAPTGLVPSAWRLEEETAGPPRVVEARIVAESGMPVPGTQGVAEPDLKALGEVFLAMQAMGDWEMAQAMGIARQLRDVPGGERRWRVVPLGPDGKPLGEPLRSRPLDSRKADPLPPPVVGLRGVATREGVELYWQPGTSSRAPPTIAWRVERDGEPVVGSPATLGERWLVEDAAFVDAAAPVEATVRYRVAALDVFGRDGPWRELALFVPDLTALDAPLDVRVDADREGLRIRWAGNPSPHTTGYVPERAQLRDGPYEALTARGVPRDTLEFVDGDALPGLLYFYRVRAMDPRGELGEPSLVVPARIVPAQAPPVPEGLEAETGTSAVTLRWVPLPGVAGYYLQRRVTGTSDWQLLNDAITPEPRHDDTGLAGGSRFDYRVVAVAHDNRESPPSTPVSVVLPDAAPPGAPRIIAADGSGGRALLRIEPALPADDTVRMLVLRGAAADDVGLVIGDPLPGEARDWQDTWVLPGETYWYRLVAVDDAGNRSVPGAAVAVRVGSAEPGTPPVPRARRVVRPFSGVELRFTTPPPGLALVIERRAAGQAPWRVVAGPLSGELTIDATAPAGPLEYRVSYRTADGASGPPSSPVAVGGS